MKELLQQIDPDYRFVQLFIVHAELKQLRQCRITLRDGPNSSRDVARLGKVSRRSHRNQHFSGGMASNFVAQARATS